MKLVSAGQVAEALRQFEAAAQLEPANPVWHFNCGLAWQQLERLDNAVAAYRRAVGLAPRFFDAWNNLGAACKAAGDTEAAVAAGQKAVSLGPQAAAAHLNLGNALKARGDLAGAEASYRRALDLEPANPKIQVNLANTWREAGRLPEAVGLLRQVVERHPQFAEAHRDLAFALLISGDLSAGWTENEWRWETEEMRRKRRVFEQPVWRGENLAGRRLLIFTEQGFGDALQFVRFVGAVAERAGEVVLECQPALRRLFEGLAGVSQLVVRGEPLPRFDVQAPLLSLPRILGIALDTIPNRVPYLSVPPGVAQELPAITEAWFKVGLVWAGNPAHQNDRGRSLPFDMLKPLLALNRVAFYSLQVGERQTDSGQAANNAALRDLSPHLADFAATAAALERLDLVICVDTAVAHLGGALAKPVWLLLPYAPDWRWLLGREDSPWYPTMRLFRQPQPGNWAAVIEAVRDCLEKLDR